MDSKVNEEWKLVPSENTHGILLEASNLGQVRYFNTKTILSIDKSRKDGYLTGYYYYKGSRYHSLIHRLVALAWLGKPESDKIVVNHKNGIRSDNRTDNLEWVSRAENNKTDRRVNKNAPGNICFYIRVFNTGEVKEYSPKEIDKMQEISKHLIKESIRTNKEYLDSHWLIISPTAKKYIKEFSLTVKIDNFIYCHPTLSFLKMDSFGLILNTETLKITVGSDNGNGYFVLDLRKGKERNFYSSHRLIAEAFAGRVLKEGEVVDHIDTNTYNNRVENLRICSQSENMKNPKTIEKLAKPVMLFDVCEGTFISSFMSTAAALKHLGYSRKAYIPGTVLLGKFILVSKEEDVDLFLNSATYRYHISTKQEELFSGCRREVINTGKVSGNGYIYYTGKGNYTKFISEDGSSRI